MCEFGISDPINHTWKHHMYTNPDPSKYKLLPEVRLQISVEITDISVLLSSISISNPGNITKILWYSSIQ